MTERALVAAAELRHRFVGAFGYGLAYGSHPAGTAGATSDLDLLFVSPRPLPCGVLEELVAAVQQLHHDHGLELDTEVDYQVKLSASHDDIAAAIALRGFLVNDGTVSVPPVVVQPWFLNSPDFRLRLLLNALTSPHAFLGGDLTRYRHHVHDAERSLALLGLSLTPASEPVTLPALLAALTHGPDGAAGEDFLGYTHHPRLLGTLTRGLAQLAHDEVIQDLNGTRFTCDRPTLTAALRALDRGPVHQPRIHLAPPGTMEVHEGGRVVD